MPQQPDPNPFTEMDKLHEQHAEKVRQGVQLLADASAQFDEFGRSKEAAIIGELYSHKAENILGAYVGPMSINLKHPGFHRRMHRTRYKPVSRLPESALRFIAKSKTIDSDDEDFDEFGMRLSGTIVGAEYRSAQRCNKGTALPPQASQAQTQNHSQGLTRPHDGLDNQ